MPATLPISSLMGDDSLHPEGPPVWCLHTVYDHLLAGPLGGLHTINASRPLPRPLKVLSSWCFLLLAFAGKMLLLAAAGWLLLGMSYTHPVLFRACAGSVLASFGLL